MVEIKEIDVEDISKRYRMEAKLIDPATIRVEDWVRMKCQFGCGGYGARLTCPPYSPTPTQTREIIKGFKNALLIHSRNSHRIKEAVPEIERELFLKGFYKAWGMGAGPCNLCDQCDTEAGCRSPRKARPAMEACGIDVFATVRANGFPIEVVTSKHQEQNHYGLILFE
jgi:predicted metal-binding protein